MMKSIRMPVLAGAWFLAAIAGLSVSTVYADLTLTSQVNMTVTPAPPAGGFGGPGGASDTTYPQTATVYIKGDKARVEIKGGDVRLYNGERQRTYVLNTADKTYWIEEAPDPSRMSRFGQLKVDSTVNLKAGDPSKPENTKKIAASDAQRYLLDGTVTVSFQPSTPDDNAGGQGGPGGPGGPGGARRFGGGPTAYKGEVWVSSTIPLPTDDKFLLTAILSQVTGGGGRGRSMAQPLLDQLSSLKGLPLKSKIAATMKRPDGTRTITREYDVKSISTSSLDDSLFRAPDDYEHIDPPQRSHGGWQR